MIFLRHNVCCTTLMALALATSAAHAVVLSDRNDRIVTPGQPAYSLNLDGVALLGAAFASPPQSIDDIALYCTGTLITGRHILTAAHCIDEDEDGRTDAIITAFPLFAAFELANRNVLLRVNTAAVFFPGDWPANADLAILELEVDAPSEIPRYPLYGLADEVGRPIVIAGYGDTGYGATGVDPAASLVASKRAGLNRYDAVRDSTLLAYDFDSGQEQNNALGIVGIASDLGFALDEVLSAPGDSGGPAFIDGAIAGITSYGARLPAADVDEFENGSWGETAFDTRISSLQDFILTVTDGQAVFIPEPTTWALCAVALAALACRQTLSRAQARRRERK